MILHKTPLFLIYFGDAKDELRPGAYLPDATKPILAQEPFAKLRKLMRLQELHFLHQVHGVAGVAVAAANTPPPFGVDGDYLITDRQKVGLGVMTADCLPIIVHDRVHNVVGIAHAGWRGAVADIARVMLERMQQEYQTDLDEVRIFFGPSAKACCYTVGAEFSKNLEAVPDFESVLHEREDGIYFDLPAFNRLQLERLGIKKEAINTDYNICTICHEKYCSYRRQKEIACRQMTVVCLT